MPTNPPPIYGRETELCNDQLRLFAARRQLPNSPTATVARHLSRRGGSTSPGRSSAGPVPSPSRRRRWRRAAGWPLTGPGRLRSGSIVVRGGRANSTITSPVVEPDDGDLIRHPDAGDLAVLGALFLGQDRWDEAEEVLLRSLAIWEYHFGPHHYEVAVVQHSLAALTRHVGTASKPSTLTSVSSASNETSSALTTPR